MATKEDFKVEVACRRVHGEDVAVRLEVEVEDAKLKFGLKAKEVVVATVDAAASSDSAVPFILREVVPVRCTRGF